MDAADFLIDVVIALLVISAATMLEPRLGVAAPLLLVAVGIGASLLPFAPAVHVEPEWIITGVLTPLLYSAAVSMPAMDFRREFAAISALSVVLVVASALILGVFFAWVIPGLGIWWGIALGAIVSPTDAVAATIIKRAGAPARVVTILQGESLLNDATALVLLRSAVAGAVASVTLWGVVGNFVYAVAVAAAIGYVVGRLNLAARARIKDATVNTVISFTVPFLAAIPAEELGASGLVAAGVAGLVTGNGAARVLSPRHRLSDAQNWRTVEFILEGAVFLVMGLQLSAVVGDVRDQTGVGAAVGIAAGALLLTILVRAAFRVRCFCAARSVFVHDFARFRQVLSGVHPFTFLHDVYAGTATILVAYRWSPHHPTQLPNPSGHERGGYRVVASVPASPPVLALAGVTLRVHGANAASLAAPDFQTVSFASTTSMQDR